MLLEIFGFMHMSATDILDILMVAGIIYLAFRWIRGSAAMNIFIALMTLFLLRVVVAAFNMKLMSALLGTFIDVGVLALIVIFQPEIRHFLNRLGAHRLARTSKSFIGKLLGISEKGMDSEVVKEITEACRSMSESKTGALIVLPHKISLEYIIETGDRIDSMVNRRLLMNLFFKNSPLHDGAVIISDGRIVAARCTLPITDRQDLPARYGMRHKAAIGVTEDTDADVIVVSEETGGVSFVHGGVLSPIHNINELKLLLSKSLDEVKEPDEQPDAGEQKDAGQAE